MYYYKRPLLVSPSLLCNMRALHWFVGLLSSCIEHNPCGLGRPIDQPILRLFSVEIHPQIMHPNTYLPGFTGKAWKKVSTVSTSLQLHLCRLQHNERRAGSHSSLCTDLFLYRKWRHNDLCVDECHITVHIMKWDMIHWFGYASCLSVQVFSQYCLYSI